MTKYGTTLITVSYQSSERKTLTWWNKEQNTILSVDSTQQLNLYSKLKIIFKNIMESRQVFTQLITYHYT